MAEKIRSTTVPEIRVLGPSLPALHILSADRRGSSLPVLATTSEGPYFVKLRGAAQGTAALVAEALVAAIAERLDLPVPRQRLVSIAAEIPSDDKNAELADLLRASIGENLGFQYLEGARPLRTDEVAEIDADFASRVVWLDWLVLNPDRSRKNPNILVHGGKHWLIDHGAALPFHHDWASVTEDSANRAPFAVPHALESRASRLAEWDGPLTAALTREVLEEIVSAVPASFLRPLLPRSAPTVTLERRRAAYAAFLWKRLRGPRHFLVAPVS
jgi:hypothetical protein